MDLPAASAVVGGQAQHVDQAGKRRQRELVEQHESDAQLGFTRRGVSGVKGGRQHVAIIQFFVDALQEAASAGAHNAFTAYDNDIHLKGSSKWDWRHAHSSAPPYWPPL
ncbi:hypothetical protein D3C72_2074570 [compost metagenome]